MPDDVKNFEVTVQDILYPDKKIPFYRIKTPEHGFISLTGAEQAKKFEKNNCYEVQARITEKGFKNDGMFVRKLADKEKAPLKQYTKARTDPIESVRLGAHGMTNALLMGWAQGRALDEILETPNDKFRLLLDKMEAVELSSHMQGVQTQTRDDLNDQIPFP